MKLRHIALSAASAAALALSAAPSAAFAEPVSCAPESVLADAQLVRVLRADKQFHAKSTVRQQVGVELFVPAQPGLTSAWIERMADCGAAEGSPLAVEGARTEVREGRGGYLVRITAADRDGAAEVIRRAETTYKL